MAFLVLTQETDARVPCLSIVNTAQIVNIIPATFGCRIILIGSALNVKENFETLVHWLGINVPEGMDVASQNP